MVPWFYASGREGVGVEICDLLFVVLFTLSVKTGTRMGFFASIGDGRVGALRIGITKRLVSRPCVTLKKRRRVRVGFSNLKDKCAQCTCGIIRYGTS